MRELMGMKDMGSERNAEDARKVADMGKPKSSGRKPLPSRILELGMHKEPGIDGILVTVGLCIIALLLCMVMKESLAGFIETIVEAMTEKARIILNGTTV